MLLWADLPLFHSSLFQKKRAQNQRWLAKEDFKLLAWCCFPINFCTCPLHLITVFYSVLLCVINMHIVHVNKVYFEMKYENKTLFCLTYFIHFFRNPNHERSIDSYLSQQPQPDNVNSWPSKWTEWHNWQLNKNSEQLQ